jgi:hypothetical protein
MKKSSKIFLLRLISILWVTFVIQGLQAVESSTTEGSIYELDYWGKSGNVYMESAWITEKVTDLQLESPITLINTLGDFPHVEPGVDYSGSFESPPFTVGDTLFFYLGGTFYDPEVEIGIKDIESGETLAFLPLRRIDGIALKSWRIPGDWKGKTVILYGYDHNPRQNYWLAISPPQTHIPKRFTNWNFERLLFSLLNLLIPACIHLLSGLGFYLLLKRFWKQCHSYFLLIVLTAPLLLGYLVFYVFLKSIFLGHMVILAGLLLSCVGFIEGWKRMESKEFFQLKYYFPVFVMMGLSIVMTQSILHLEWNPTNSVILSQNRLFLDTLPLDNYLPYLTSERLYTEEGLKPYIIEWRSTDRPPLQAAAVLLMRPFLIDSVEGFQVYSAFLHSFVLLGVAYFLKTLGLKRKTVVMLTGMILFSGIFVINMIWVRPKFLPVFHLFWITGMLLDNSIDKSKFQFWLMFGIASCCSVLIHPGSAFALLPILIVFMLRYRKIHLSQIIAATIVFVIFMLPWTMFKNIYDPPGNMLAKRFFANHPEFDDVPLKKSVIEGYSQLTLEEWARGRMENVLTIFGNYRKPFGETLIAELGAESFILRVYNSNNIGICVVPLILGLLFLPYMVTRAPSELKKNLRFFTAIILIGFTFWVILILPPGRTILPHGSLYFPILIMLLSVIVASYHSVGLRVLYYLNLAYFVIVWALPRVRSFEFRSHLYDIQIINPGSAVFVFASIATIVVITVWTKDDRTVRQHPKCTRCQQFKVYQF